MKKYGMVAAVLAVAMIFSVVASAVADSVTYDGTPYAPGRQSASGTVNVNASVNPKITLTVTTPDAGQTVDFGDVDPDTDYSDTVGLSVNSNKAFDLSSITAGEVAELGFTHSLADQPHAKGANVAFSDTYGINVPYTTDPGAHSASVTYTVVQN